MKYALSIAALLLAMTQQQPATAQGNGDNLVKQAVAAQGGAELRGLKGLAIKSTPSSGNRGSRLPQAESRASWGMRRSPSPGISPTAGRAPRGTAIRNTRSR